MGAGQTVHNRLARPYFVTLMHADVFAFGNLVLNGVSYLRGDNNSAFSLDIFTEGDNPVNLTNDGDFLWFACFEELCYSAAIHP